MDVGKAVCVKKLGTIGCTVAIMHADSKLPHEIRIKDRHEVGLSPLPEISMITGPDEELPEPIVEEAPTDEILEEVIEEEPEAEVAVETSEEAVEETVVETEDEAVEVDDESKAESTEEEATE